MLHEERAHRSNQRCGCSRYEGVTKVAITVTADRAAVLLFSCLQCYQRASTNHAVLQQWPGGVISRRSWTSEIRVPGLVAYKGSQKFLGYSLWWWMLNALQHFQAFWVAPYISAQIYRMTVITDSSCVGTSVPMLPKISLLKDDAVWRVGCYWGREAKKELFESNSLLILVHFQGNTQN